MSASPPPNDSRARPYAEIARPLTGLTGSTTQRMQAVADALWEHLSVTGVSWVGFYLYEGGDELVLGPHRDKPACSPIGLHGVCGQAFAGRRPIVVRDVAELGDHYIACDPRDRSEVVVPLFDAAARCGAVLDLDSHNPGAFDLADVSGLQQVLHVAGLSPRASVSPICPGPGRECPRSNEP
ncbi:MAG TPA: GAF domain-containing protein [Phycisphaerae bacterium]|nr:GAF domain-containing protein [Phycisphaerae bacterium]HNU46887.1 GAF domain-containing protein [Phycisphaerae bacterium]